MEKTVTMVINNTLNQISMDKFFEYTSDPHYKVKKVEEEEDKFVLLEKMHG